MSEETNSPEITVPYDQFHISSLIYWIEANGYKPHLLVHTVNEPGLRIPAHLMAQPMTALNVSSSATHKFQWFDDRMEFNARFNMQDFRCIIPYQAIDFVQFAHTGHAIPMPWTSIAAKLGGVPMGVDGSALKTRKSAVQPLSEPQTPPILSTLKEPADPVDTDGQEKEPEQGDNVRKVDFRSPRKPR